MTDQEKRCGTCGWWQRGRADVIGECSLEMEATTFDKQCDINMWRPKEESEKEEKKMKEVFVVDGNLEIHPVQVLEADWEKGGFVVEIVNQFVLVSRDGSTKITTYAGFETREEAEEFKDTIIEEEKDLKSS